LEALDEPKSEPAKDEHQQAASAASKSSGKFMDEVQKLEENLKASEQNEKEYEKAVKNPVQTSQGAEKKAAGPANTTKVTVANATKAASLISNKTKATSLSSKNYT